jgi:hypothetical protein
MMMGPAPMMRMLSRSVRLATVSGRHSRLRLPLASATAPSAGFLSLGRLAA